MMAMIHINWSIACDEIDHRWLRLCAVVVKECAYGIGLDRVAFVRRFIIVNVLLSAKN